MFSMMEPSLLQFYISRQWLNKFKTFAEPGPISNDDFLCSHGGAYDAVFSFFIFIFSSEASQRSEMSPSRRLSPQLHLLQLLPLSLILLSHFCKEAVGVLERFFFFFFFASLSLFSSVCCVRLEIMEWKRKYFPYCTDEQSLIFFFVMSQYFGVLIFRASVARL